MPERIPGFVPSENSKLFNNVQKSFIRYRRQIGVGDVDSHGCGHVACHHKQQGGRLQHLQNWDFQLLCLHKQHKHKHKHKQQGGRLQNLWNFNFYVCSNWIDPFALFEKIEVKQHL